jgi:hypothetical protein
MFRTTYYSGDPDDDQEQQRVTAVTNDSSFWTEFEEDKEYVRVGVCDIDEAGEPLPETQISLEVGKMYSKEEPAYWYGPLRELRELIEKDGQEGK